MTDPVEPTPESVEEEPHDESGLDLARAVARGLAGRTGPMTPKRAGVSGTTRRRSGAAQSRASGAHPDERDPQTIDAAVGRMVTDQGWETELRVHAVFGRWAAVVGREVAEHAVPEAYADGRLVVRTDSTAWATQMRLLRTTVLGRLAEVLGEGVVTSIEVLGPRSPSWSRGRLRVKGRGPRDTYG